MDRLRHPIVIALWAASLLLVRAAAGASLESPEQAGLRQAGDHVFVDPDMPREQVESAIDLVDQARKRAGIFYGELVAHPKIVFCASSGCYREFGAVGLGYTDGRNLVISPYGRRVAIIAHELAHVEFAARIGGFAKVLKAIPQWFDEGQAVMVSMAEEFSEEAWMSATHDGKDAPDLDSLAAMNDWLRLTGAGGENMQLTYGTARHEVNRWFGRCGQSGFQALLAALYDGQAFAETYARMEAGHAQPAMPSHAERPASDDFTVQPAGTSPDYLSRIAW